MPREEFPVRKAVLGSGFSPNLLILLRSQVFKIFFWIGAHGHMSPKGTHAHTTLEDRVGGVAAAASQLILRSGVVTLTIPQDLGELAQAGLPKDREWTPLVTKRKRADGTTTCCGNKRLKVSQAYPDKFGETVAAIYQRSLGPPCVDADESESDDESMAATAWRPWFDVVASKTCSALATRASACVQTAASEVKGAEEECWA